MMLKLKSTIALRLVCVAIICGLLLSGIGVSSYAITDTASDSALAPPLATKPPCEIHYDKATGTCDVVTNNDVIKAWDKETVRSVRQNDTLGKAFRNRWAFVDVSYLTGQMLILTRQHNIQNPKDILIPLLKKHIRNRNGEAEILLEGFNIDGIEELREGQAITGFSLPVARNGKPTYRLIYNLQEGDTNIPIQGGKTVYVKVDGIASKQEIETIERVSIAIRSFRHGVRNVYDIFKDITHINAVAEYIGLRLDEPTAYLKQRLSEARSKAVDGSLRVLVKIIETGGKASKEGSLTIDDARKYANDIRDFIESLQNQKDGIRQIHSEFLNAYRGDESEKKNLSGRFDELIMKVDDAISKLQSRLEIATATATSHSPQTITAIITEICGSGSQNLIIENNLPVATQVNANRLTLTSAILNVVVNAVHFAKKKEGDNARVKIVLTEEKGFVRIDVADNGEGIPKELLEIDTISGKPRLFNLNISQREGGTGLGTTEAWYAVRDMGGTIDVQSEVGKGTTFTIRLPILQQTQSISASDFLRTMTRKSDGKCVILSWLDCSIEELFGLSRREDLKGKDVLVLGCGGGVYCFSAVLKGANRAVGVDLDENSIAIAKLLAPFIYNPVLKNGLMEHIPLIEIDDAVKVIDSASQSSETKEKLTRVEPANLDFIPTDATNLSMLQDSSFDGVAIPFLLATEDGILNEEVMYKVLKEAIRVSKPNGTLFVIPSVPREEWDDEFVRNIYSVGGSNEEYIAMFGLVKVLSSLEQKGFAGKRLVRVSGKKHLFRVEAIPPEVIDSHNRSSLQEQDIIAFVRDTFADLIQNGKPINVLDVGTGNTPQFCYRMKELLEKNGIAVNMFGIQPKTVPSEELEPSTIRDAKKNGIVLEEVGLEEFNKNGSAIARDNKFNLVFVNAPSFYVNEGMLKNIQSSLDTNGRLVITNLQEDDNQLDRQTMVDLISAWFNVGVEETKLLGLPTSDTFFPLGVSTIVNFNLESRRSGSGSDTTTLQAKDKNVIQISPESERIHATNFQDTLAYIQAQPQTQPLVVALGTSWIKGYEKGHYLQYDALNPLIGSLRTYCESKGIPFIVDDDDKLLARINAERAKDGKAGAKVVVLAGENTVRSDEFAGLRADEKNAVVVGINNQELTTDSYIRLMEMLTLALKLSAGLEVSLDNDHITITKDNNRHLYIFLPHAQPMNYEELKAVYEVQKFA